MATKLDRLAVAYRARLLSMAIPEEMKKLLGEAPAETAGYCQLTCPLESSAVSFARPGESRLPSGSKVTEPHWSPPHVDCQAIWPLSNRTASRLPRDTP
jgi:hypothetical protein